MRTKRGRHSATTHDYSSLAPVHDFSGLTFRESDGVMVGMTPRQDRGHSRSLRKRLLANDRRRSPQQVADRARLTLGSLLGL